VKPLNPNAMKSNAKPSFYFSAYPLKTIKQTSSPAEPSRYLKGILTGKSRPVSRTKVLPMVNPYVSLKNYKPVLKPLHSHEDVKLNEGGWYNNYE
jgi:hypothetical protein